MKIRQKVLNSYIEFPMIKQNNDNETCYLFY